MIRSSDAYRVVSGGFNQSDVTVYGVTSGKRRVKTGLLRDRSFDGEATESRQEMTRKGGCIAILTDPQSGLSK